MAGQYYPGEDARCSMNRNTLLFRQISPSWMRNGCPMRQAFTPTAKDKGYLSVYDGDMITAEESWLHHTQELGLISVGVIAVTFAECAALELPVTPDPAPFPSHAIIHFTGYTNSQIKDKAKVLSTLANQRGWQYRPGSRSTD